MLPSTVDIFVVMFCLDCFSVITEITLSLTDFYIVLVQYLAHPLHHKSKADDILFIFFWHLFAYHK